MGGSERQRRPGEDQREGAAADDRQTQHFEVQQTRRVMGGKGDDSGHEANDAPACLAKALKRPRRESSSNGRQTGLEMLRTAALHQCHCDPLRAQYGFRSQRRETWVDYRQRT